MDISRSAAKGRNNLHLPMVTYLVEPFFSWNKLWRLLEVLELDEPAIIRSRKVIFYNTFADRVCKPLPLVDVLGYVLSVAQPDDWIDVHTQAGVHRNVKTIAQLSSQ